MKLIIAILRDVDNDPVSRALTSANFRVTMIASTGGFWRRGNTTLLIGLEDSQVPAALEIIRKNITMTTEPGTTHATIFVLNVSEFVHF
ncbi:MAG TPA: cyclic-di-AMP receptor [Anaerolineaceae bacterium]